MTSPTQPNSNEKKKTSSTPEKKNSQSDAILKKILAHNPFDPFCDWARKKMKDLGVLDIFDEFVYWNLGRANFINLFKNFWGYNITGKENFPEYGGALVISNHQSELDPFLVGSAVHRKVQWLSKAENFKIPIFRSIITPFGTIPIQRGKSDEHALDEVRAVLETGGCIGMFPEGTRSDDGNLGKFHSGAARLCLETGVPYVPCAIFGAYKVFPKHVNALGIKWRDGLKISVTIGKPVYIDPSLAANPANAQLIKQAMRHDISLLKSGLMNKSRVIRSENDIAPGSRVPMYPDFAKEPVEVQSNAASPSELSETDDLSIS